MTAKTTKVIETPIELLVYYSMTAKTTKVIEIPRELLVYYSFGYPAKQVINAERVKELVMKRYFVKIDTETAESIREKVKESS